MRIVAGEWRQHIAKQRLVAVVRLPVRIGQQRPQDPVLEIQQARRIPRPILASDLPPLPPRPIGRRDHQRRDHQRPIFDQRISPAAGKEFRRKPPRPQRNRHRQPAARNGNRDRLVRKPAIRLVELIDLRNQSLDDRSQNAVLSGPTAKAVVERHKRSPTDGRNCSGLDAAGEIVAYCRTQHIRVPGDMISRPPVQSPPAEAPVSLWTTVTSPSQGEAARPNRFLGGFTYGIGTLSNTTSRCLSFTPIPNRSSAVSDARMSPEYVKTTTTAFSGFSTAGGTVGNIPEASGL